MRIILALILTISLWGIPYTVPVQSSEYKGQFIELADSLDVGEVGKGAGMGWGDFDGDGYLDLYVSNPDGSGYLYRNERGGKFSDVTVEIGLEGAKGGVAAVWGDYDNDGNLDLFISGYTVRSMLWHNNGGSKFEDVSAQSGIEAGDSSQGAAWGDYDNDGKLDLYVAKDNQPNRMYSKRGGAVFQDVADSLGVADVGNSSGVAWGDFDNDGHLDLYVTRFDQHNRFYRNERGRWRAIAAEVGVDDLGNGVGATWGDYNNDGYLDLYIINYGRSNRLFGNDGGRFTEVAGVVGVDDSGQGQGAAWGDYNNDGYQDLYVVNGGAGSDINRLYHNEGGKRFVSVGVSVGVGNIGWSSSAAWGDYDNDGDLDLYVVNNGQSNRFYRNDLAIGNNWIGIVLKGKKSNRSAIGVRIRVVTGEGSQIREVSGGSGYLSQNGLPVLFGLGQSTKIDSLSVKWSSGHTQVLIETTLNAYQPVQVDGTLFSIPSGQTPTGSSNTVAPSVDTIYEYDFGEVPLSRSYREWKFVRVHKKKGKVEIENPYDRPMEFINEKASSDPFYVSEWEIKMRKGEKISIDRNARRSFEVIFFPDTEGRKESEIILLPKDWGQRPVRLQLKANVVDSSTIESRSK